MGWFYINPEGKSVYQLLKDIVKSKGTGGKAGMPCFYIKLDV
jgi:hypothetical protein